MEEKRPFTDEELVEEVSTEDDAPVEVIYRCKKCGQILTKDAKDGWKCSGKEIVESTIGRLAVKDTTRTATGCS